MRHALAVAAAFGILTAPLLLANAQAQTIIYLNFDEQEDVEQLMDDGEGNFVPTFANRDPYTLGGSEVGLDLPAPYDNLNLRFEYKSMIFSGPYFGPTPEPVEDPENPGTIIEFDGPRQGGKSLLVQPEGGEVAGIRIISDNGIGPPASFTMEAIWWTTDIDGAGNTAGIQSIMGSENVGFQEFGSFFVRTVQVDGRPWMDYWNDRADSAQEGIRVQNGGYTTLRFHHDALVFEFNEADPASCTVRAYRDGELVAVDWVGSPYNGQTQVPYNAYFPRPNGGEEGSLIPTILFGTRGTIDEEGPLRMIALAYNSSNDPDNDPRGPAPRAVCPAIRHHHPLPRRRPSRFLERLLRTRSV
jgi:hypothetical protein